LGINSKQLFISVIVLSITITTLCIALDITLNNQKSTTLPNFVVPTKTHAIDLALPIAQAYAQENNRTITTVNSNIFYVDSRPTWQIDIHFEPIHTHEKAIQGHPYGIYAYCVAIWGDTGEIRHHNEQSHS
jgi:hypothetical protein